MKTIYLIRHGETKSNRKGIFRGRLDIPLSKTGREQAEDLKQYFEHIPIDKIYTSPLKRAVETAEIAFPNGTIITDPLLDNLDLGEWSGMEKKKVQKKFPGQWELWVRSPESIRFPGGESLDDVLKRCEDFCRKVVEGDDNIVVAVAHRSVAKVLVAWALGVKNNYYWKFHLDNASVSQLNYEEERKFTLIRLNDTHHLKDVVMEWY